MPQDEIQGVAFSVTARPSGLEDFCRYYANVEISNTRFEMEVGRNFYDFALAELQRGNTYAFTLIYVPPDVRRDVGGLRTV